MTYARFLMMAVSVAMLAGFTGSLNAQTEKTATADLAKLSISQPLSGQTSNANTYDIDYRVIVTAPYKTKKLKVWLPIPQTDKSQQISGVSFSTFPANVTPSFHKEKKFGNKFAYFEFENPAGAQIITFRFRAVVHQMNWNLDLSQVKTVSSWPEEFQPFLRTEFDSKVKKEFDSVLNEIVPEKKGTAMDVQAVLDWTSENLSYSHSNASLKADVGHALDKRQGHCSDYHGLCSALGRKLGYPARVTYGMAMFEKASPSHCKLEVFLPPHGWVPFDVSETQKLIKLIDKNPELTQEVRKQLADKARKRLLTGFRDNTWLQVTRGTNFVLAPEATQTVPLVRTIYAEADGKPLKDPDPSNQAETQFSWMTSVKIRASRNVRYPYKNIDSLK